MTQNALSVAPFQLPFDAMLTMPGSKSHANRAIIAACLSSGETIIRNATACDDVNLLVKNLQKMGFDIRYTDRRSGVLTIRGGIPAKRHKKQITLYCGNAGTTLRFLTALASVVPGSYRITGDEHMQKRPIGDLVNALRGLGADIQDTRGCPPVIVGSSVIEGGTAHMDISKSSQFLSALLLIKSALPKGLRIKTSGKSVSKPYIALTEKVLEDFKRKPTTYVIEGDHSAAGTFLVLAELSGSSVSFSNLHRSSTQGDAALPRVITRMRKRGDITIDCSDIPDQVMNLAVLAACRNGKTILTGIVNLRYKECDRLSVLSQELRKAGVNIREKNDDLVVCGKAKLKSALLDPHNDHRMAFCFAIVGSVHPGIRIKHPECVSKSYPQFFHDLESLHHSSKPIALIGMRGVGKSTLGRQLAPSLGLKHIDTDSVFESRHGNIRTYFQKKGLVEFRKKEERIVAECLEPNSVVSLGGGAIESLATRKMLKERAVVIHLQARTSSILQRLKKDQRPLLTRFSLEREVPLVMKRRSPLYESIAHISLTEPHSAPSAIQSLQELCSL